MELLDNVLILLPPELDTTVLALLDTTFIEEDDRGEFTLVLLDTILVLLFNRPELDGVLPLPLLDTDKIVEEDNREETDPVLVAIGEEDDMIVVPVLVIGTVVEGEEELDRVFRMELLDSIEEDDTKPIEEDDSIEEDDMSAPATAVLLDPAMFLHTNDGDVYSVDPAAEQTAKPEPETRLKPLAH
jgi:hypothetical protein